MQGRRRARTHSGVADLITIWDIQVWGDLLGDRIGHRQSHETIKGQSDVKGEAEHGEVLIVEFVTSK